MGILAALVSGLVLWIVLWAVIGTKSFDGFLPTIGIVLDRLRSSRRPRR